MGATALLAGANGLMPKNIYNKEVCKYQRCELSFYVHVMGSPALQEGLMASRVQAGALKVPSKRLVASNGRKAVIKCADYP